MASNYEIPAYGASADKVLGFMKDAVSEGESWLKFQRPTTEWPKIDEVLAPNYGGGGNAIVGQSNVGYNKVRAIFTEQRATLANFKHAGEFVPVNDDAQEQYNRAHMLTNLDRHWERVRFAGEPIRDALGYALAKGTGYLYEDWDAAAWGPGIGDIRLTAFAPEDVTFVQLPKNHEIQQAYIVLIRHALPLNLAKRMYSYNPAFANALTADQDSPSWVQRGIDRVQQFLAPALRFTGQGRKTNESFPVVYVWHAYIMDASINETGMPITMGAKDTNWQYRVPALGDELPQGIINPRTGAMWTLPAKAEDCLLFPLRRMTVFSNTGVAYDGSSPWLHGEAPIERFRFNDLPWEALGASQYGDSVTIQEGIINLMRSVEDSAAARLDPPALYDEGRVDKNWAEAFNPRKAGIRAGADLQNGAPIEYPFPPQFYDVPPWIVAEGGYIKQQEQRIEYLTKSADLVAVAKARQIPSADSMEKLMEMAGPVVQDMVNALIKPMTRLGEWRKAYFLQFYTRTRMIQVADPDATEMLQDVRYIPDKLQQKRFEPESIVPKSDDPNEPLMARSARVRSYLSDFRYEVNESGLSEMFRMSRQLLYVQLMKEGFPIDWWTMAKITRVDNFGPPPAGTNTTLERWIAQRRMTAEMEGEFAADAQQAAAGAGGQPPDGAAPPDANGNGNAPPGQHPGPGRPPSFQKAPRIAQKDGGTRSTVVTS